MNRYFWDSWASQPMCCLALALRGYWSHAASNYSCILCKLRCAHVDVMCSVFSDRLVDDKDMETFVAILTEKLGLLFDQTFHNICPGKQPPIFGKNSGRLLRSFFCRSEVKVLTLIVARGPIYIFQCNLYLEYSFGQTRFYTHVHRCSSDTRAPESCRGPPGWPHTTWMKTIQALLSSLDLERKNIYTALFY